MAIFDKMCNDLKKLVSFLKQRWELSCESCCLFTDTHTLIFSHLLYNQHKFRSPLKELNGH